MKTQKRDIKRSTGSKGSTSEVRGSWLMARFLQNYQSNVFQGQSWAGLCQCSRLMAKTRNKGPCTQFLRVENIGGTPSVILTFSVTVVCVWGCCEPLTPLCFESEVQPFLCPSFPRLLGLVSGESLDLGEPLSSGLDAETPHRVVGECAQVM